MNYKGFNIVSLVMILKIDINRKEPNRIEENQTKSILFGSDWITLYKTKNQKNSNRIMQNQIEKSNTRPYGIY